MGYFNSRPSARGDDTRVGIPSCNVISIHAPPRGATYATTSYVDEKTDFNSRPSARGDSQSQQPPAEAPAFQFTPLREGRQRARKARRHATARFQFTPLREGRLTLHDNRAEAGKISIHAPPRGATRRTSPPSRNALFQFTPLREGRHQLDSRPAPSAISIHAPPRGATAVVVICAWISLFQFTPLREGRRRTLESLEAADLFQFTPLREGRPRSPGKTRRAPLFQFTPLREGRPVPRPAQSGGAISIHAPPRGATRMKSG